MRLRRSPALFALVVTTFGCGSNSVLPVEAYCRHEIGVEICNGIDDDCNGVADDSLLPGTCAATLSCRSGECCSDETIRTQNVDLVDLLLMVDNSNSMQSKQEKLRRELPDLVRGLVTGDIDGDGSVDPGVTPVKSIRVGVVTSDMGVAGTGLAPGTSRIVGCGYDETGRVDVARANYGDDGVLRTTTHRTVNGEPVSNPVTGAQVSCDHAPPDGRQDTLTAATMPAYLTFDATPGLPPAPDAVDAYVDAVACVTAVGTGGCGFEQQLESVLKAITPKARVPFEGAFFVAPGDDPAVHGIGHEDDPATNGSWFRDDAVLAIIEVTDEDDCSARDPVVFDANARAPYADDVYAEPGHLSLQTNTRCQRFEDTLHSVERYVQGILATRARKNGKVYFGAITGVPLDLTDDVAAREGVDNLPQVLASPEMQEVLVSTSQRCGRDSSGVYFCPYPGCTCDAKHEYSVPESEVAPTCTYDPGTPDDPTDDETATPARRIVRVASELHDDGVAVGVQSICQPDFHASIRMMLRDILRAAPQRLDGACLDRPQTRNPIGEVDCDVQTTLAAGDGCAAHPGLRFDHMNGPREVCIVAQIPVSDATRATGAPPLTDTAGNPAHGWYYDDYTSASLTTCVGDPRIAFTTGDALPPEAELSFSCCEPGRLP